MLNTWINRDPTNLDLARGRSSAEWATMTPQMNWLVQNHQGGDGLGPDLAQSWDASANGLTYTFRLVQNARWHDGKPVTADDVIYTIERITKNIDGKVPAPPYKGAMEFITSMEKPDAATLRITLSKPSASFLAWIGAIGNAIYPKHVPIAEFEAKKPIGSGPFIWKEFRPGASVDLAKNASYWKQDKAGRPLPYLDGLKLFVIASPATGVAAYRTGQVDITFPYVSPILGQTREIQQQVRGTVIHESHYGYSYITFRFGKEPWTDKRVRQAFHLALDREAFALSVEKGEGDPYVYLAPAGSRWGLAKDELRALPGYNPSTKQADIAKAKELLAAAKVDLKALNLSIPARDVFAQIGEGFVSQVSSIFGAQWKVRVLDSASTVDVQQRGAYDIYANGNSSFLDDPSTFLTPYLRTDAGTNYTKLSLPDLDRQMDQLDTELDPAKRKQLANSIERLMIDEAWVVVLSSRPNPTAAAPAVKNFRWAHSQDGPPVRFENVWLER